ncbi:MAG: YitT family protein [Candidatus Delongbacteria bacterium]|nr:YitT family protein [Candidatus Delongbacteria bacterium]
MKSRLKTDIAEYSLLVVGSILSGLSMVLFFIPHKISPGGVSGISMILHYLFHLPVGLVSIAFNIPLFLTGLYLLGRTFGIRTLIGFTVSSLSIDFMMTFLHLQSVTQNTLLATIYGSLLMGTGLGIIFRVRGTTGGSDIIAQLVYKYFFIKPGTTFLVFDGFIALLFALIFKSIDLTLYALIGLFISGKVINFIIEGWNYAASVFIISSRYEEITGKIIVDMGRGATILKGEGIYTHQERPIIYCVISIKEISRIKQFVREIDPEAFIIINEVHEVLGEGFRPRT